MSGDKQSFKEENSIKNIKIKPLLLYLLSGEKALKNIGN